MVIFSSGASAPPSGTSVPLSGTSVPPSGTSVPPSGSQSLVIPPFSKAFTKSLKLPDKVQQSFETWQKMTKEDYKIMETQYPNVFHEKLLAHINGESAASAGSAQSIPRFSALVVEALDRVVLSEIMKSTKHISTICDILNLKPETDRDFVLLLKDYNSNNKKQQRIVKRYGNKSGLMLARNERSTQLEVAESFSSANIDICLDPSQTCFVLKGNSSVTPIGIISLVLKVLSHSEAGEYVNKRQSYSVAKLTEKIDEKEYDFCPDLDDMCIPMIFELRKALDTISMSGTGAVAECARILFGIFNPFDSVRQEQLYKLWKYSTIIINPQLSKMIEGSANAVRPEQVVWIAEMRRMYMDYAEHIVSHKDQEDMPAFHHLKALPAQMGSGKTTIAAIATGPLQMEANDILSSAKVPGRMSTVIIEPSLRVTVNFASCMPTGARTFLIINGRVVPMYDACPVELTGSRRRPERYVTSGNYEFSHEHSTKGRDKGLRGLSIFDQFRWFFNWSSRNLNLKPSRSSYAIPTHIFCDPKSASEMFSFKAEFRKLGIYLVGMVDEVVACADCSVADPVSNPLAYWYAKLFTYLETGWLLSASYSDNINFDHIQVLPSIQDAISFTQLRLHSGELVTPLNGLIGMSQEDKLIAIASWSTRVLRLFPPTVIPQIIKMMKAEFVLTPEDLANSVQYLQMVQRLCNAVVVDEHAESICGRKSWKIFHQEKRCRDSTLYIYTGNPSDAAIQILGEDDIVTRDKIDQEIQNYDKRIDEQISDLRHRKGIAAQMIKDRESGSMCESPDEIQEEIDSLIHSKSRPEQHIYTFSTKYGASTLTGAVLDRLLMLSDREIAIALSGIQFDSLAFSPKLNDVCYSIKYNNRSCEFVGIGNVYGVNDASINHVVVHGDPTNFGRESVCQAAGRTARTFDGRNQIGFMTISENVLKVFGQTTSIMDRFAQNIRQVDIRAATKIQALVRGHLYRKTMHKTWNAAAIRIQTIVRSFIARVIYQRMRNTLQVEEVTTQPTWASECEESDSDSEDQTNESEINTGAWHNVGGAVAAVAEEEVTEPVRVRGTIQNWIHAKTYSYGFIDMYSGGRMFIHEKNMRNPFTPNRGEEVEFEVISRDGRDEAVDLTSVRYTGSIQRWLGNKDFGFIDVHGGERLFIHLKNVRGYDPKTRSCDYTPRQGHRVEFSLTTTRGRDEALDLVLLQ